MKRTKKQGFTLLEVLLVVAIIAILAAIVILALNPSMMLKKARDAQRYSDIKNLDNAIQQYIIDYGHAPYMQNNCPPSTESQSCFTNDIPGGAPYDWSLLEADLTDYLVALPHDPCGEKCFVQGSGPIPTKFFSYEYYAPSTYTYACNQAGSCGDRGPVLTNKQAEPMYAVYAEHLEVTENSWGMSHNQFHSY